MKRSDVINRVRAVGIIPIIRTKTENAALQAIAAINSGGLDIFEVTMTVPNAVKIIENLRAQQGTGILIGAGTVLTAATAADCLAAGAEFIVSPIFDPRIIEECQKHDVTVFAGAMTVTEILIARRAGADFIKVFPADALGGAGYLKAVKTVLPDVELVPTGGVTIETAADFIKAGAAAIGIGSDLVNEEWLQAGRADKIIARTQNLSKIVQEARR